MMKQVGKFTIEAYDGPGSPNELYNIRIEHKDMGGYVNRIGNLDLDDVRDLRYALDFVLAKEGKYDH